MTSEGTLDGRYLDWLCSLVGSARNLAPNRTFYSLSKQLFKLPFGWYVPNDDNRIEDGRALRLEYLQDDGSSADQNWLDLEGSVLEVLIALTRRLSFQTDVDEYEWFYRLLQNLGLDIFTDDQYSDAMADRVEEVVYILVHRDYNSNGTEGGLFPLKRPLEDQRKVEIWYQMSAYLIENGFD